MAEQHPGCTGERGPAADGLESGSDAGVTHCEDLWFEDGTVVLQAESTIFKVHRTILARNSTFFKDMFSNAEPDKGEQHNGCPLIIVQDKSSDMTLFLKAMYTPGYSESLKLFIEIASLLMIASKYGSKYFRALSTDKLRTVCPTTFAAWDRNASVLEPGKMIQLAQQCDLRKFLPASMYACCQLGDAYIVDNISNRDLVKFCLIGRQKIIDT
ncbi:hypothetical protein GLOTRDRAFT_127984 [Gloeophyllum trabeum ATCC 11539]|uniref:BTB domain-containing protein n=1 Tax=Gloeophyllum trabeum (strain ATCC 11539 / FP-39264 / Madison 617) TaxID=670483 RepID=S7QDY7_GLOTA|nr:uncharacterized protein GLOTRDRAFT_127984 [Gloeophyllum trabeum ATCC 11539]EPQ57627.1 hypothetical protein GLOTRDRAFT_127984 [Gloeophyllum trabeum ATCC 11539]